MRRQIRTDRNDAAMEGAFLHLPYRRGTPHGETLAPARIRTILAYALATLVIFQGIVMLFPVTAVAIARDVIAKARRRRERESELAQVLPDVWVRHILKEEEERNHRLIHSAVE
jgi:hypothetical protein